MGKKLMKSIRGAASVAVRVISKFLKWKDGQEIRHKCQMPSVSNTPHVFCLPKGPTCLIKHDYVLRHSCRHALNAVMAKEGNIPPVHFNIILMRIPTPRVNPDARSPIF